MKHATVEADRDEPHEFVGMPGAIDLAGSKMILDQVPVAVLGKRQVVLVDDDGRNNNNNDNIYMLI